MTNSVPKHPISEITFLGSFPRVSIAPKSQLPEFAFLGRSNVGKSSLINYICDRKKLAKTSGTPGKTQMINLFEINKKWILADLPGYGYARISKKTRAKWSIMIEQYLLGRKNLKTVFLLIDTRIPPQQMDLEKVLWLGKHQIPFSIVFTKADKLKPAVLEKNIQSFMKQLSFICEENPNHFMTSANGKIGKSELLEFIQYVSDL